MVARLSVHGCFNMKHANSGRMSQPTHQGRQINSTTHPRQNRGDLLRYQQNNVFGTICVHCFLFFMSYYIIYIYIISIYCWCGYTSIGSIYVSTYLFLSTAVVPFVIRFPNSRSGRVVEKSWLLSREPDGVLNSTYYSTKVHLFRLNYCRHLECWYTLQL